jgi:hypothetical protein
VAYIAAIEVPPIVMEFENSPSVAHSFDNLDTVVPIDPVESKLLLPRERLAPLIVSNPVLPIMYDTPLNSMVGVVPVNDNFGVVFCTTKLVLKVLWAVNATTARHPTIVKINFLM